MNYKDKVNKMLSIHRAKEIQNVYETKKEINLIMYVVWLREEIRNIERLKNGKVDKRYTYNALIDTLNVCYDRYMFIV